MWSILVQELAAFRRNKRLITGGCPDTGGSYALIGCARMRSSGVRACAPSTVRDACRPDSGTGEDGAQLPQRLAGERLGDVERHYQQGGDLAFVVAVRLEGAEVEWVSWPEPEDTTVAD